MVSDRAASWTVRGVTFVVWAAAAASAAYWIMKFAGSDPSVPRVAAASRQAPAADPVAVARLLGQVSGAPAGAAVAQPSGPARLQLVGVVADRSQRGAALIAVDGKPPKPFRVGVRVDEGLVLQSVQARKAVLGPSVDGPASITLELPVPSSAGG